LCEQARRDGGGSDRGGGLLDPAAAIGICHGESPCGRRLRPMP
jgi:hypothetical protein